MAQRLGAVLILGPTGSGKTPLGDLLERRGLRGRRCHHFDFGEQLRRASAGAAREAVLSGEERECVRGLLAEGALLEDAQFGIAAKLLGAFLAGRDPGEGDLVVLNGLPRHAGQAARVDELLAVEEVVFLSCTPEVVRERISADVGGDRAGRTDDSGGEIAGKLEIFAGRTAPLVEHYRRRGAELRELRVGAATLASQLVAQLEEG
jgi:adenylate kinase family enzyme